MARFILVFFFILILISCDTKQTNNNSNKAPDTNETIIDESANEEIANEIPAEIEEKILDEIRNLPEVKQVSKYMDSIPNHERGMAFIIHPPEEGSQDFYIRAGLNGEYRFETYYHFYLDTNDYKVKIQDILEADIVDMEEWRKREERRK